MILETHPVTCTQCGSTQPEANHGLGKWTCWKCGSKHRFGRYFAAETIKPKSKTKKSRSGARISREEY